MGDSHHDPLRVDFDRQINLQFHGSTVTSDAGFLACVRILKRIARLRPLVPRGEVGRPDKRVRKLSPGVRGAPGGRLSGTERRRSVWWGMLRPRGGSRRRYEGKIVASVPSGG
jgi:hypothetical protein